jgi:hypothetical protein
MPYFLVRQKVNDYAKWKQVFDGHAPVRVTAGSKGGYVYRNSDNPNEVFVLLEVKDLQKGREFAKSEDLRKTRHLNQSKFDLVCVVTCQYRE